MLRMIRVAAILLVAIGLLSTWTARRASAQVVVTTLRPAVPVVSYLPERRGLFGRRVVYRPFVSYAAPAAVTAYYLAPVASVTTHYAPPAAASVTTYYAPPAAAPVTTYYAPPATVVVPPVTTHFAPSAVTTYYPPVVGF